MTKKLHSYRFLVARRIVQATIMLLFIGANYFGWKVLSGNYSSALAFDSIHLTDPFAALQILAAGFAIGVDATIGALIILLFYALIAGRSFCSWVCPMNPVMDLSNWLNKKWKLTSKEGAVVLSRNIRYWILALSLILSVILGYGAFEMISPIGILHRNLIFGFGTGLFAVLFVFLIDLLIKPNAFCGYLCPLGAFYSLISKFRLIKVKHIQENCTQCNKCFAVCPEKQVLHIVGKQSGPIVSGECTNCARCIEVCDDNALKFKILK